MGITLTSQSGAVTRVEDEMIAVNTPSTDGGGSTGDGGDADESLFG